MPTPQPSLDHGRLKFDTASGRWQIRPFNDNGFVQPLHEISSGDVILIEVAGEMKLTRIEYSHSEGGYYSTDFYPLTNGLEAALPARD